MSKPKILSKRRRLNHLYHITDKRGHDVVFKFNEAQERLHELEKEERKKNGKYRISTLKARQLGITTYKVVDKLDKALFYRNTNAVIVAHDRTAVQEIFLKVKYAYERLPNRIVYEGGVWDKPKTKYDNKNELTFPSMNSAIRVSMNPRSGTKTDIHITEAAFIRAFLDMLRGTEPTAEFGNISIETTANGMNEFQAFWNMNAGEETVYTQHFEPWFTNPEYSEELREGEELIIPEELKYFRDVLKLTDEQIKWYLPKYRLDPDGTKQEFPSSPHEAFITSGMPFFDTNVLNEYKTVKGERDIERPDLIRYNRDKTNDAIFGIDLAEGLEHGDKTVVRVRNREGELICSYRGTIEPGDTCKLVDYIYSQRITGIIAPERNNHGHTFLYAAKEYSWYYDIYAYEMKDKANPMKMINKIGWSTDMISRPMMLDELKMMVRDKQIELDEDFITEAYTFNIIKAKPQAEDNCHDDVIMADAICLQMLKEPSNNYKDNDPMIIEYT